MIARLTALLLAAVFCFAVYRAAQVPITPDEAFTYTDFVARPVGKVLFGYYDANNHVLHSLLCMVSTGLFGVSELSLRLPALLGAVVYLCAVFVLCRRVFAGSWLMPAASAWMALHPTVFDFLSLARGYGLALGCFLLAALLWDARRANWAGVCLGLAVSFNLVFALPAAIMLMWRREWKPAVLSLAVAIPVLAGPLSQASREKFYFGVDSVAESLRSVFGGGYFERPAWSLVAVMVCGFVLALRPKACQLVRVLGIAGCGSAAVLAAAHLATGAPYPYTRTGIYFVPVAVLGLFAAVPRRLAAVACGVGLVVAGWFVAITPPDYMIEWRGYADTRGLAGVIRAINPRATVGASHSLGYTLRFYLPEITVVKTSEPAELWALLREDRRLLEGKPAQTLYAGERSEVVLARVPNAVNLQ